MNDSASIDVVATWIEQPLKVQLLELMMLAGIIGFLLLSLYFFIKALKPDVDVTTKSGSTKISFFRSHKKKVERPSLLNHRYFRMMHSTQISGFFQMETNSCTQLAKDVINLTFLRDCKFKVFEDGMRDFVAEIEALPTLKAREERTLQISDKISELITTYEEMSKSVRIALPGGAILYGVPSVYLSKFNKWHGDHTTMCLNSINDVLSDKLYEDWYATLRACLDYLYVAFDLTIQDARLTLKDLNGDLDKEIQEILSKMSR